LQNKIFEEPDSQSNDKDSNFSFNNQGQADSKLNLNKRKCSKQPKLSTQKLKLTNVQHRNRAFKPIYPNGNSI